VRRFPDIERRVQAHDFTWQAYFSCSSTDTTRTDNCNSHIFNWFRHDFCLPSKIIPETIAEYSVSIALQLVRRFPDIERRVQAHDFTWAVIVAPNPAYILAVAAPIRPVPIIATVIFLTGLDISIALQLVRRFPDIERRVQAHDFTWQAEIMSKPGR
jgi:hypothetical protein